MMRYLMTSVSCLALTGAASAADMPVKAPPRPVIVTQIWAGPYIGINGGVVWNRLKTDTVDDGGPYDSAKLTGTSGTVGAQIGYNWQSQNFVYGLEADANWLRATKSEQRDASFSPGALVRHTAKMDWLATFRARAGFLLAPRTLVYATGGLAVAGVDNEWRFVSSPTPEVRQNDTRVGWTAGGGIEQFISNPHVTVKAEALYVDLGRETIRGAAGSNYTSTFRNSAIVGRLGLNLKW